MLNSTPLFCCNLLTLKLHEAYSLLQQRGATAAAVLTVAELRQTAHAVLCPFVTGCVLSTNRINTLLEGV